MTRRRCTFAVVAVAALLLKLSIALLTFGTNDVLTFERMLDKLDKAGVETLYDQGTLANLDGDTIFTVQMNHPPFALTMLRGWQAMQIVTGLPMRFWMRAFCSLADFLVVWLLWNLAERGAEDWRAVMVVAVAPAAVMVSGFHGNTDSIMIALVVTAAYLIETRRPTWLAGAAFGLSCSVKVWPIVLIPVLFLALPSRKRLWFVLAAACTGLCAAMPWILTDPELIVRRVFDYSPVQGWWGLSLIWKQSLGVARYAVFVCCLGLAVLMYRRVESVIAQCAIVVAAFLFLAPGFGPQYMAWIVPWTCAAGWRTAAAFNLAAGMFLFGMYNTWSLGMPWYFGNAYNLFKHMFPSWVYPAGIVTWALLPLLAAVVWWRTRARSGRLISLAVPAAMGT